LQMPPVITIRSLGFVLRKQRCENIIAKLL
jgi:hypothetical protein